MTRRDDSTIVIGETDPKHPVECPYCGWVGQLNDLRKRYIDRSFWKLRNREGYEFLCPECGSIVIRQYISR